MFFGAVLLTSVTAVAAGATIIGYISIKDDIEYLLDQNAKEYKDQQIMRYFEEKCHFDEITVNTCNFTNLIQKYLDSRFTDHIKIDVEEDFYYLNLLLYLINYYIHRIDNGPLESREALLNTILDDVSKFLKGRPLNSFTDHDLKKYLKKTKVLKENVKSELLNKYKNFYVSILPDGRKRKFLPGNYCYLESITSQGFNPECDKDYLAVFETLAQEDNSYEEIIKNSNISLIKKMVTLRCEELHDSNPLLAAEIIIKRSCKLAIDDKRNTITAKDLALALCEDLWESNREHCQNILRRFVNEIMDDDTIGNYAKHIPQSNDHYSPLSDYYISLITEFDKDRANNQTDQTPKRLVKTLSR